MRKSLASNGTQRSRDGEIAPRQQAAERAPDEAVRSVQRALQLLSAFSPDEPRLTLTEITQRTDLPLTTVARLLATLESLGFLRRFPDGSYGLGIQVLQLGIVARQTFDIIDAAGPVLEDLNAATGENTNLAIRSGDSQFTYVRQLLSRHPIRHTSWVGKMQPLAGTANGEALRGRVGAEGYVAKRKTFEADVTATAAPVRGADGEIVAAISVTGPTYRITDAKLQRYSKLVLEAARRLSETMGGRHAPEANPSDRRR